MRLEKLIIEGFRSYADRVEIEMSSLTAMIGENDVGKSTILEALDAFFNDVADAEDVTVRAGRNNFTIGCIFSDLPDAINVDAASSTTLQDEFLLNNDSKLEIYKVWRSTSTKADVDRIFARAIAPTSEAAQNLLFKKRDELREIVGELGLEADRRQNPSMRKAIYDHLRDQNDLGLALRDVELDRPKDKDDTFQDARKIWKKLRDRHLPVYSLFKAENVRGDKETAVRSPLDATLKRAIKELEEQLAEISEQVEREVRETTTRTLERLRQDYPEIAQSLVPEYKAPSWSKAFDLDVLRGDDDIPLNKRGTGVRRLVVLAFFQAEADKKRRDRAEGAIHPPVIYAIEEPETSQHPNFQRSIVEAMQGLVAAGDQVILTTHVPGLAELLPLDSIRFIDRPQGSAQPRIRNGASDKTVLQEAAASLGVWPSAVPSDNAQIAVWVEGDSDVWVLESIGAALSNANLIPAPLDLSKVFYVFGGGGDQLKSFVNGEYLNALGLPQFYLRDSDKENDAHPGKELPAEIVERVRKWEEDREGAPICVLQTRKREIENYVHPATIDRVLGAQIDIMNRLENCNLDFDDISSKNCAFWEALKEAKEELGFRIPERRRRGVPLKHRNPKHVICGILLSEATLDELRERCATTDIDGSERSEIEEWFHEMSRLIGVAGCEQVA
jgi:putative ATP-dependent endonuclease of the OLD family